MFNRLSKTVQVIIGLLLKIQSVLNSDHLLSTIAIKLNNRKCYCRQKHSLSLYFFHKKQVHIIEYLWYVFFLKSNFRKLLETFNFILRLPQILSCYCVILFILYIFYDCESYRENNVYLILKRVSITFKEIGLRNCYQP